MNIIIDFWGIPFFYFFSIFMGAGFVTSNPSERILRYFFYISFFLFLVSLFYFFVSDSGFSTNLVKYPEKILPAFLLLFSIGFYFSFVMFILMDVRDDWIFISISMFFVISLLFAPYQYLLSKKISDEINNSIISNKPIELNKYKENLTITKTKNLNIEIAFNNENICDYFVANIFNKKIHYFKNIYKIDSIILNNKKYDSGKYECKTDKNIVSYNLTKMY